jgi:hypothetical protein
MVFIDPLPCFFFQYTILREKNQDAATFFACVCGFVRIIQADILIFVLTNENVCDRISPVLIFKDKFENQK